MGSNRFKHRRRGLVKRSIRIHVPIPVDRPAHIIAIHQMTTYTGSVDHFKNKLHSVAVVPFLIVALLVSSSGQILCVGQDGRTALESANPMLSCVLDTCGDEWSQSAGSTGATVQGAEGCVDTKVAGFITVRSERVTGEMGSYPLPDIWFGSRVRAVAGDLAKTGERRFVSRGDSSALPLLQEAYAPRSVILLV